jgi:hypothetical protein
LPYAKVACFGPVEGSALLRERVEKGKQPLTHV